MRERVAKRVIRRAEGFFEAHQVDYECCRADEEDFHRCVVDGDEVHEEVQVSHAEHDQVEFLSLAGEADTVTRFFYSVEEDQDS